MKRCLVLLLIAALAATLLLIQQSHRPALKTTEITAYPFPARGPFIRYAWSSKSEIIFAHGDVGDLQVIRLNTQNSSLAADPVLEGILKTNIPNDGRAIPDWSLAPDGHTLAFLTDNQLTFFDLNERQRRPSVATVPPFSRQILWPGEVKWLSIGQSNGVITVSGLGAELRPYTIELPKGIGNPIGASSNLLFTLSDEATDSPASLFELDIAAGPTRIRKWTPEVPLRGCLADARVSPDGTLIIWKLTKPASMMHITRSRDFPYFQFGSGRLESTLWTTDIHGANGQRLPAPPSLEVSGPIEWSPASDKVCTVIRSTLYAVTVRKPTEHRDAIFQR